MVTPIPIALAGLPALPGRQHSRPVIGLAATARQLAGRRQMPKRVWSRQAGPPPVRGPRAPSGLLSRWVLPSPLGWYLV